jgi:hypothetical protein
VLQLVAVGCCRMSLPVGGGCGSFLSSGEVYSLSPGCPSSPSADAGTAPGLPAVM